MKSMVSHLIPTSESVTRHPNYEIMHNSMNGLRCGDVVSSNELVSRLNMLNKPVGGNKNLSYFKETFPGMFGELFVETCKPLCKNI